MDGTEDAISLSSVSRTRITHDKTKLCDCVLTKIFSSGVNPVAFLRHQSYYEKPKCYQEESKENKDHQKPQSIRNIFFGHHRSTNYSIHMQIWSTNISDKLTGKFGGECDLLN